MLYFVVYPDGRKLTTTREAIAAHRAKWEADDDVRFITLVTKTMAPVYGTRVDYQP